MDTIRKVDLNIQAAIGIISILSLLPFSFSYILLGEMLLGAWQVISALINTFQMFNTSYRKRIIIYWILTVISLVILAYGDDMWMMGSIIGSWGIAIYYWVIYRSFINYRTYRSELSTVVRNK